MNNDAASPRILNYLILLWTIIINTIIQRIKEQQLIEYTFCQRIKQFLYTPRSRPEIKLLEIELRFDCKKFNFVMNNLKCSGKLTYTIAWNAAGIQRVKLQ